MAFEDEHKDTIINLAELNTNLVGRENQYYSSTIFIFNFFNCSNFHKQSDAEIQSEDAYEFCILREIRHRAKFKQMESIQLIRQLYNPNLTEFDAMKMNIKHAQILNLPNIKESEAAEQYRSKAWICYENCDIYDVQLDHIDKIETNNTLSVQINSPEDQGSKMKSQQEFYHNSIKMKICTLKDQLLKQ